MRTAAICTMLLAIGAGTAFGQSAPQSSGTKPTLLAAAKSAPVKPVSTPASRSAAELALSSEPVYDEGTFRRLKEALLNYSDLLVRGGWPRLPADAKLGHGSSGPAVELLRQRLAITGDLSEDQSQGEAYDGAVVEGVKKFQLRHGLDATGDVGAHTLAALNVPVKKRVQQIEASLERLANLNFGFGPRYVVVNIPAAFVEAIANDKVERRNIVIVGKADKQSPVLTAAITSIDLNPTWTVPPSITKSEIVEKMRKDPSYLSRMHMRVLGAHDAEIDPRSVDWSSDRSPNFTVRQDAGTWNALGALKIDMPNSESVYMHDTDARNLFTADYRFLSHGCTRVDNVRDLAAWLMKDMPGWSRAEIDAAIATGQSSEVRLPKSVPVAWVYLTAWAMRDGTMQFRDDVYDQDTQPEAASAEDAALDAKPRGGGASAQGGITTK